jgi:hypothetical protein
MLYICIYVYTLTSITFNDGSSKYSNEIRWNNMNLIRISEKIKSKLVFAHVRAASPGFPITETNCHPWCYGKFLWMHNGYIAQFKKVWNAVEPGDIFIVRLNGAYSKTCEKSFSIMCKETPTLNGSLLFFWIRYTLHIYLTQNRSWIFHLWINLQ